MTKNDNEQNGKNVQSGQNTKNKDKQGQDKYSDTKSGSGKNSSGKNCKDTY